MHSHHHEEKEELPVLLKYLVNHNRDHNEELKELAEDLDKSSDAYKELIDAINTYDIANKKLESVLEKVK